MLSSDLGTIQPGGSANASLALTATGQLQKMDPLNNLQTAVKTNAGVAYFAFLVPFSALCSEDGNLARDAYLAKWKEMGDDCEFKHEVSGVIVPSSKLITAGGNNNIFNVAKRNVDGKEICYMAMKFINGVEALVEATVTPTDALALAVKTRQAAVVDGVVSAFRDILA